MCFAPSRHRPEYCAALVESSDRCWLATAGPKAGAGEQRGVRRFCGRPAARPDGARPGGYPRLRQGRYGEGLPGRHSARSPRGSPRRDKVQSPLVHGLGGALGGRLLPRLVGGCASPAIARLGHSVRPIAGLGRRQHWWRHVVAPGNLMRPWRGLLRRGRAHPVPPRRHALRKFAEGRPGSGQFGLGVFAGPPCWLVV